MGFPLWDLPWVEVVGRELQWRGASPCRSDPDPDPDPGAGAGAGAFAGTGSDADADAAAAVRVGPHARGGWHSCAQEVARLLAAGQVIGVVRGRQELGPH